MIYIPPKKNTYDTVVRDFLDEKAGHILAVSDDSFFFKTLQSIIYKTLSIKRHCLDHCDEPSTAFKKTRELVDNNTPLVLIVERLFQGKPSTEFLFTLKKVYPEVSVLVLTDETDVKQLSYMHEVGAKSILTKPASANDIIEKLAFIVKPPEKLGLLIEEAKKLLARKEYEMVLNVAEKVLAIKPGSAAALMLAGDAYLCLGNRRQAIECYEEAHQGARVFLDPIKKLVDVYAGYDDENHLKYLKLLNKLSPLNIKRKYEIGKLYLKRGDVAQAEEFFDQAVDTAISDSISIVDNVMDSIVDSISEENPELTEKYLTRLLEFKGNNLTAEDLTTFTRLGIAFRKQGKWKEAIENYEKALRVAPKDEGLFYNIGMAYIEGGVYLDAVEYFGKALKINPELHTASKAVCKNLAVGYDRANQLPKALKFYKLALEMAPGDKELKNKISELTLKLHKKGR